MGRILSAVWILGLHLSLGAQGPCLDGGQYYEKQNKCYYMGGTRLDPDKWIGLKEHAETWIQAERYGFYSGTFRLEDFRFGTL